MAGGGVAADHAGAILETAIWPRDTEAVPGTNGRPPISMTQIQRGLVVLAEAVHDDGGRAFEELETTWLSGGADQLVAAIADVAIRLRA